VGPRPELERAAPLEIHPVSEARWDDLVELFDRRGGCRDCWCLFWRIPGPEFRRKSASAKRRAMKALVDAGARPGLLAYVGDKPVGWCALAPRHEYTRLERSPTLKPLDDEDAWAIVCFYIAPEQRNARVASRLLEAAVAHARDQGARIVEGYPIDHASGRLLDRTPYTGVPSMFRRARFREVARRSAARPIMRRKLRPARLPGADPADG
jgi:GNAT superfamily N-acetyltransferase